MRFTTIALVAAAPVWAQTATEPPADSCGPKMEMAALAEVLMCGQLLDEASCTCEWTAMGPGAGMCMPTGLFAKAMKCGLVDAEAACVADADCMWGSPDMGGAGEGGEGGMSVATMDLMLPLLGAMACAPAVDEAKCKAADALCKWDATTKCTFDAATAKCPENTLSDLMYAYVKAVNDDCYTADKMNAECSAKCKTALTNSQAFGKQLKVPEDEQAPLGLMVCMRDMMKRFEDAKMTLPVMDGPEIDTFYTTKCYASEADATKATETAVTAVEKDVAAAESGKAVTPGSGGQTADEVGASSTVAPAMCLLVGLFAFLQF